MKSRKTFDDVAEYLQSRGYEILSDASEYIDTRSRIRFMCPIHGEQEKRASHILYEKQCCSRCGWEESGNKRRRNFDYFVDICKQYCEEMNFTYVEAYRKGIGTKGRIYMKYICNLHSDKGVQEMRFDTIGRIKSPCSYCVDGSRNYWGEVLTTEYLEANNIKYYAQYKFADCKYKQNLYFDFFLPDLNICIEYNGLQHYQPCKLFGGEDAFKEQVIKDNIKRKYCNDNNIGLVEIPYTYNTKDKIKQYLDERL